MPALQFATVDQELYNWAVTSFNKISIIECIKFIIPGTSYMYSTCRRRA